MTSPEKRRPQKGEKRGKYVTDSEGIPKALRTDPKGHSVSPRALRAVVNCRLSRPSASLGAIAKLTGLSLNTVGYALKTRYAQEQCTVLQSLAEEIKKKAVETVGDSVEFMHLSVQQGLTQLDLAPKKQAPHLISNARECATTFVKGTILPDKLKVQADLPTPDAFASLDDNPILMRYKELTGSVQPVADSMHTHAQGEGEIGTPGLPSVGGGPPISSPDFSEDKLSSEISAGENLPTKPAD